MVTPAMFRNPRTILFILLGLLIPGLCAAKIQAPITTALDVVTTPTAGGAGVVSWTGLPQITPDSAEIVFLFTAPGATQPATARQPLKLSAGKVTGATYEFATPVPGLYTVIATVNLNVPGGRYSKAASIRLNVPKTGPAVQVQETPLSARDLEALVIKNPSLNAPSQKPLYANTGAFTVSGTLKFTKQLQNAGSITGMAATPIRAAYVEIRDQAGTTFIRLNSDAIYTDDNGNFSYTLPNNIDGDGTGLDLYLHIVADTNVARVQDLTHAAYYYDTPVISNWGGGNLNLGTITVPVTQSGPWNIYDTILSGFYYAYDQETALLGNVAAAIPPKTTVTWSKGNSNPTQTMPPVDINLQGLASDPDEFDDPVILHEYAHVITVAFSYANFSALTHFWDSPSTAQQAWAEGWADFFSSAVRNNQYYTDYAPGGGISLNLETNGILTSRRGETLEGCVAASLWDIFDSHSDGVDTLSDGISHIWAIFTGYFNPSRSCTIKDFYNAWKSYGYSHLSTVQAILNDQGINYGWKNIPQITSFKINAGASSTVTRLVTLNLTATGNPAFYKASESSSFTGASWKAYSTAPQYTLTTAGNGTKTIYLKVMDNFGNASDVKTDTITLSEPPLAVTVYGINYGAATTPNRNVTLNNSCAGTPVYYMASESSTYAGAVWIKYSGAPSFRLSAGNGAKTVYFKVMDAAGNRSASRSDAITLAELPPAVVTSFKINNGAATATSRVVTLNNTVTGSAVKYMASESSSFTGAAWLTYSAAPQFTITSAGNGTKTVYFKVLNASSYGSKVTSDTIKLSEIVVPVVTSFQLNAGGASTASRTVALNNVCTGSPSLYMASELSDFRDVTTWTAYSTTPYFTITSTGNGTKTVYFKVKTASGGVSAVASDTIDLNAPLPVTIDGAAVTGNITSATDTDLFLFTVTTSGPYTINTSAGTLADGLMDLLDIAGTQLSESDDQGSYKMPMISMNLDAGTYMIKFRGANSKALGTYNLQIRSGSIYTSLVVDNLATPGNIANSTDVKWYQLWIGAQGTYTIRVNDGGSLANGKMYLYRPGDRYPLAYNEGEDLPNNVSMPVLISTVLSPGTYNIAVQGYGLNDYGSFSIQAIDGADGVYQTLIQDWLTTPGNLTANYADYYTFYVPASEDNNYFTIQSLAGNLQEAGMTLFDANSKRLSYVEGSGTAMPSMHMKLPKGLYYITFNGLTIYDAGSYGIQLLHK